MAPLPEDIQQVLDALDVVDRAADTLAAPLTEQQFRWQPEGGTRWSVAQCLDHLAVTNEVYGAAIRGAIDRARARGWSRRAPLAPGFFGRKFVSSLEPPVKHRARTFAIVEPNSQAPRDEILARYHQAHAAVRQLVVDAATIDANRATYQNPFVKFVRVRVATGLHVILAHDRRHLWQAEQVVSRPDFPAAASSDR